MDGELELILFVAAELLISQSMQTATMLERLVDAGLLNGERAADASVEAASLKTRAKALNEIIFKIKGVSVL